MSNLSLFSQNITKLDRNIFTKLVKEKGTDYESPSNDVFFLGRN